MDCDPCEDVVQWLLFFCKEVKIISLASQTSWFRSGRDGKAVKDGEWICELE